MGVVSGVLLLKPPGLPNCPAIFWPVASASLRLYCAQVAANKRTLEDVLEAIALVNNLPADHPLRPEINRLVEQWSLQVLDFGEQAFHRGELKRAIEIAHEVPANTRAHAAIPARIDRWRSIWGQAEAIHQKAERLLQQQNWRRAFSEAVRLLAVGNRYWETTQYEALNQKIIIAQMDERKIGEARGLARRGGMKNLEAAMRLVQEISPNSYFRQKAGVVIAEIAGKMLDLAAVKLAAEDLQGAIAIAQQIPQSASLWEEAQDFITLADAQSWTWSGTVLSLEEAIARARQLGPNRPLHQKAQQLIARWELEIVALNQLDQAQELAQPGSMNSLKSAIAVASQVSAGNPRWSEVRQEVNQWTQEIQTMEDRPTLDQADQYASVGDRASLNSAIRTARRIGPGRSLYQEAQNRIQDWTWQLKLEADQQRSLNQSENLDSRSQKLMQSARRLSSRGTPQDLASAIKTANQVNQSSLERPDADLAIDQWSQRILEIAQQRAKVDRAGAIAIAQQIPSFTNAYADAQFQIQTWKSGN